MDAPRECSVVGLQVHLLACLLSLMVNLHTTIPRRLFFNVFLYRKHWKIQNTILQPRLYRR